MATLYTFMADAALGVGSAYPAKGRDAQNRLYLAFDAAADETCDWTFVLPQATTLPLTAIVHYYMASGTTGNVILAAQVEAITPADALDMDSASSFDTANSATSAVPGTQGYLGTATISLTNADSIAAGDYARLRLFRDADNGSDTAAGDCRVLFVELRDAA